MLSLFCLLVQSNYVIHLFHINISDHQIVWQSLWLHLSQVHYSFDWLQNLSFIDNIKDHIDT